MIGSLLGAIVAHQQAKLMRDQAARMRRQQEYYELMHGGSATPYQDELAAQLARCQREQLKIYERRRFYCAGYSWEATVWVGSQVED